MKWLKNLFGRNEEKPQPGNYSNPRTFRRYGNLGELPAAVRNFVARTSTPFTIRDVAAGISYVNANGQGLHKTLRELEREGIITASRRHPGGPITWTKAEAKPHEIKRLRAKGVSLRVVAAEIMPILKSADGPMSANEIRVALGREKTGKCDPVYKALRILADEGDIRRAGFGPQPAHAHLWEAVKPVEAPKPVPVCPSGASPLLVVPFCHEGDFRVVAKRDKRVVVLIEAKRADALGKENWVTAETNILLYQQALKAVCGRVIGG